MKLNDILEEAVSREQALQVLGLSNNYTADELKKAIRSKRSQYHPDRGGDLEKMKLVNQSADLLQGSGGSDNSSTAPGDYERERDAQNKKYNDLAKVVSSEIVSKFKPEKFTDYFSKIFGTSFGYKMKVIGDKDAKIGGHSHAGIDVKFFSNDKSITFDFSAMAYLFKVISGQPTFSGSTPDISYNLSVVAFGYFNRKKQKMAKRDWDFKNNHAILKDPSLTFPEKKLMKIANTDTSVPVKMKKADFRLAMKNEVGARKWNDNSFLFPTQDGHILVTRMVFMRVPGWFVKVGDLKEKYSFIGVTVGTMPEDSGTIDNFLKASKMTNEDAIDFLKEKKVDKVV